MNITTREMSGKRLACFVDGRRFFHMHKADHKAFYRRVELLRKQARVDDWLAEKRAALLSVQIEPVQASLNQLVNQAITVTARSEGTLERHRRFKEGEQRWIDAGMPVSLPSRPSIFIEGVAHAE